MHFDFKKYLQMLTDRKIDEAIEFRNSQVPQKLYKYVGLNDNSELNDSKFNDLESNKLWMSRVRALNDPFENKAMYLNILKFEEKNYPENAIEFMKTILKELQNSYLITSLTNSGINNMPMWAHYASNHQGICIEYDVISPKLIIPVSYEEDRIPIASILTRYLELIDKIEKGEINDDNVDFQFYLLMLMHSATIKHKSWEYEYEYRVLIPKSDDLKKGRKIDLHKQGLRINKIYVGSNCSVKNEKKIRRIFEDKDVQVSTMRLEDESSAFKLTSI